MRPWCVDWLGVGVLVFHLSFVAGVEAAVNESARTISHQVLPVLMQHCWPCHSSVVSEGGLNLETRASLLKGGDSGPGIRLGDGAGSLLVQRLRKSECPPSKRLVEAGVKPVPASSIDQLEQWIQSGATEPTVARDQAGQADDPLVRQEDRSFWSFVPPRRGSPRSPLDRSLFRNPIDAFVQHRLEQAGLGLGPEAARRVLLRRLYFDLTGLPPGPEELERFENDPSPDAYERQVEKLLASAAYGERWGRYWLDVAGYSDVDGKREQHLPRKWAYRYRDYVIRSFNDDKPFDRFLQEQIAGDELADAENAGLVTPEIEDNLVATGFLRMSPDPTWANITGFIPDRLEVMADAMDVLGGGVMGLTLRCARCHNHKSDPIPQRDYYRLVDVFKGALDEYRWLKPGLESYGGAANLGKLGERSLKLVDSEERGNWERTTRTIQEAIRIQKERLNVREKLVRQREASRLGKELNDPALSRMELIKLDAELKGLADHHDQLERSLPPEPKVAALWDRGIPSPTFVYRRGDFQRPGELVFAGFPAVLSDPGRSLEVGAPWPGSNKTGRRLAFSRWLTESGNPLTSRVFVNRVWKHHFGSGIVRTLDNFGKTGAAPTHPELLDWLATEFVRSGWRIKALHRLMVTSQTYRQSSLVSAVQAAKDPDNKLMSRMPLRRLDAEAFWDSLIEVGGVRRGERFGPAVGVTGRKDGAYASGKTGGGWRRSIYGLQTRKEIPVLLDAFDMPSMNPNCVMRSESIVPTQALHLMNDPAVREVAEAFARRVRNEAGPAASDQIERAFLLAFGRRPGLREAEGAMELWKAGEAGESRDALVVLCRSLFGAAEFIYVD